MALCVNGCGKPTWNGDVGQKCNTCGVEEVVRGAADVPTCANEGCGHPPSGTSLYCSLDCMHFAEEGPPDVPDLSHVAFNTRFKVGDQIACNCGDGYWPHGVVDEVQNPCPDSSTGSAPKYNYVYKVMNGNNLLCIVPADTADCCVMPGTQPKRFQVGERVAFPVEGVWKRGEVLQHNYREPKFDHQFQPGFMAPYQCLSDDNDLVYQSRDDPSSIVREGEEPRAAEGYDAGPPPPERTPSGGMDTLYPLQALHKDIFVAEEVDRWLVPELRSALQKWWATGDPADIEIALLPGIRNDAPGVISFDCFSHEFCDKLLEEVDCYQSTPGLPSQAPNSMNNYGVILNGIGMKPFFTELIQRFNLGIASRFFGDDSVRATMLNSEPTHTSDWGGSSINDHHTFVVQYEPGKDIHLDMHTDACDVTFNFGLTDSDQFEGNDLVLCGMLGTDVERKRTYGYSHVKGRCMMHSGKLRHGAQPIKSGKRSSLIMWTHSDAFRQSPLYKEKYLRVVGRQTQGLPDKVCLSKTHDVDYSAWLEKLSSDEAVLA